MALFKQFNLMDYSLLFAVEKVEEGSKGSNGNKPRVCDPEKQICYYGDRPAPQRSADSFKGIAESKSSQNEDITHTTRHKYVSSCGQYIYHLAIIDYLQTFNFEKKSESRLKIWILRRPAHLISAVEPSVYGDRFIRFMS